MTSNAPDPVGMLRRMILIREFDELAIKLRTAGKIYGRPEEAYLLAAVVYFVVCYSLSYLVKRLQAKIAIIR